MESGVGWRHKGGEPRQQGESGLGEAKIEQSELLPNVNSQRERTHFDIFPSCKQCYEISNHENCLLIIVHRSHVWSSRTIKL